MKNLTYLQKAILAFLAVFLFGVCSLSSVVYHFSQIQRTEILSSPTSTIRPTPLIVEGGLGQQVINFKVDDHGQATYILASHHADRDTEPFIVTLYDGNGNRLSRVFFQLGGASKLTSRQNLKPGLYYLEVVGEEWNIVIGPA